MAKESEVIATDFVESSSQAQTTVTEITRRIEEFKEIINGDDVQDFLLWEMLQSEFDDCAKDYFDAVNKTKMNVFRSFFKKRGVWVQTDEKSTAARAIMNVIHEKKRFD